MDLVHAVIDEHADTGQHARRQREQRVRQRVVDLAQALAARGHDGADTAQRLGLNERTLRQWLHDLRQPAVHSTPLVLLGRPRADSGIQEQQAVISLLTQRGPSVGVPTLRAEFPDMARSELTDLLHCYRTIWQTQHTCTRHVLRWLRPGSVWAMDFAQPPTPIDGV